MFGVILLAALQAQPMPPIEVRPPPRIFMPPPPAPPPPNGSRPAVPRYPLVRLFSVNDYPASAIDSDQQGRVRVAIDVGPNGRVFGCTVEESSDSAALDSATCQILRRRARFSPARDKNGNAIAYRWRQRVRWELFDALPFVPLERVSRVATTPRGRVGSCAGSMDCTDGAFDLDEAWPALTGRPLPPSSALIIEHRFDPGDHAVGQARSGAYPGYELAFAARARVGIGYDGKVSRCVALGGGAGDPNRLCSIASQWLFKLGSEKGETRTGVISLALRARPLGANQATR